MDKQVIDPISWRNMEIQSQNHMDTCMKLVDPQTMAQLHQIILVGLRDKILYAKSQKEQEIVTGYPRKQYKKGRNTLREHEKQPPHFEAYEGA